MSNFIVNFYVQVIMIALNFLNNNIIHLDDVYHSTIIQMDDIDDYCPLTVTLNDPSPSNPTFCTSGSVGFAPPGATGAGYPP